MCSSAAAGSCIWSFGSSAFTAFETSLDSARGETEHYHPQLLPDGSALLFQVEFADGSVLAQLSPGQSCRFQEVSLAEAQALYLAQEHRLRAIKQAIAFQLAAA